MPPPPPATRADGAGSTAEGHGKNGRFEARNTLSTASLSFSDGKKLRFKGFLSEMRFLFPVEAADGTKPGVTRTTANGLPRARGGHGTDTLPLRHACQHASGPRTARPAPEDGGRGTLGRSPRMSEKTCRSVPGVPSRPPGRSTRQAHPRVLARPHPRRSSPEPAAGRAGELDTATGASGAHGGRTEGRTPAPRAQRGRVGLGQAPGAPATCAMRGVPGAGHRAPRRVASRRPLPAVRIGESSGARSHA